MNLRCNAITGHSRDPGFPSVWVSYYSYGWPVKSFQIGPEILETSENVSGAI
jgi:hypothetical protein